MQLYYGNIHCRISYELTNIYFDHITQQLSGKYGRSLHVWDWKERTLVQDIDLGDEGLIPLELRFLHDPEEPQGYVGIALSSNVFRFYKTVVSV